MMRRNLLTIVCLFPVTSALAQGHAHGEKKGPHGGMLHDVVGVEIELIISDRTLTLYIYSEDGKPVSATGFSGSALVGSGQTRQVVQFAVASENTLVGTASAAIPKGASVTVQIKAPSGKSGQVKS
jgi:hypothetical protein